MIVLSGDTMHTLDRLKHTIQVLQQLQRLLPMDATLEDVADVLACVEAAYGAECLLEDVIQRLVGEHITMQLTQKTVARRKHQIVNVAMAA
jgi:hypothetical protein